MMVFTIDVKKIEWNKEFNIFDEKKKIVYRVETQRKNMMSHSVYIYTPSGQVAASAIDEKKSMKPKFYVKLEGTVKGTMERKLSFGASKYVLPFNNWKLVGKTSKDSYSLAYSAKTFATLKRGAGEEADKIEVSIEESALPAKELLVFILIELMEDLDNF